MRTGLTAAHRGRERRQTDDAVGRQREPPPRYQPTRGPGCCEHVNEPRTRSSSGRREGARDKEQLAQGCSEGVDSLSVLRVDRRIGDRSRSINMQQHLSSA